MKECTNCNQVREDFSAQKTNASKLYAWCDECRSSNSTYVRPLYNKGYNREIKEMRAKAVELRKFNSEQSKVLKNRYDNGEKVKNLAVEYSASTHAVYKAIRGYK